MRLRLPGRSGFRTVALLGLLLLAVAIPDLVQPREASAHEIPERVAITMLVHPEGARLRVLLRIPLASMRDLDFPERADGTIDVAQAQPLLAEAVALWVQPGMQLFADDVPLAGGTMAAVRLTEPSDRSFAEYPTALAHVTDGGRADALQLRRDQALLDVMLEYPITDAEARFAVEPALAHLGVRTTSILRLVLPDGTERAFQYTGDPGRVTLDPRWYQAAGTFVGLGFRHILEGIDHLLFILCLVIPVRRWRPLVAIVSAFTVAHSITLAAAAFGFTPTALWFPPLVELCIAASIVYMALENMLREPAALERRWPMAFAFGLVHGFGFSFALQESLQFAGAHLVTSLAAFNVGVELGQLLAVAVAVPVLAALVRRLPSARALTVVLSALVAHSAWHWMIARGQALFAYDLAWRVAPALLWLGVLRVLLLAAVAGAAALGLSAVFDRWLRPGVASGPSSPGPTGRVDGVAERVA